MNKAEALSEIRQKAELILTESREPAVRLRLLRDIFHRPDDDPELAEARQLLGDTEWIRLLTEGQEERGYFMRLKKELRGNAFTTAFGIALDIGLTERHPILAKAKVFAEWCLSQGVLSALDQMYRRPPGSHDLCVFERDLASMLAKVDRESPLVEEIFGKWVVIAGVAFESGKYDKNAQIQITQEIFDSEYNLGHSIRYPEWILAEAATLLATQADLLDPADDTAYVKWCVLERHNLTRRIERLLDPSRRPSHKSLFAAEILLDMESLYGFRSWGVYMEEVANCFWKLRRDDGFWNFGSACANPYFTTRIRLSDNWRGKRGAHDWTTRVLLLLQKYYEL